MKLFFNVIMFFFALCNSAYAQLGYGPEFGFGLSTMHFAPVIGFTSASKTPIPSIRVGGGIDKDFNAHIYYQLGLLFTTKGQKRQYSFYTNDSSNDATDQTLHLYYIDLPANVVFKTGRQGDNRFFIGFGATFSALVFGRNILHSTGSYNDTAFNVSSNSLLQIGSSNWPVYDIGLNIIAGYESPRGLYFKFYYTPGIEDIGQGTEIDKNRILGFSAGYFFGNGRDIAKEADDLIDKGTD